MVVDRDNEQEIRLSLIKGKVAFVHSPLMWSFCKLDVELQWKSVKFNKDHRKQVPNDKFGIYAFMLEPDFKGPPSTAYLLYVGKTEENFRERYRKYLPKQSKDFGRMAIEWMLQEWDGYIWFHYAEINDKNLVYPTEQALLNACIPPYNAQFRGRIGNMITAFRTGN